MTTIAHYELLEVLGRGGMGTVWRARNQANEFDVALKLLDAERDGHRDLRRAFRREAQTAAKLDHPHIVRILDFGVVRAEDSAEESGLREGTPWLAMELVAQYDWRARLSDWSSLSRCLLQTLDALGHAHARDVIHRDLKLENILGDPTMGVQLTDFGIAAVINARDSDRQDQLASAGTPWTMAPEQFAGDRRRQGPWTDIYGLGCVGWILATGAPPFTADTAMKLALQHTGEPLPRFVPRMPVPEGFEQWLRRCLEKKTLRRFREVAGARFALARLAERGTWQTTSQASDEPSITTTNAPTVVIGSTTTAADFRGFTIDLEDLETRIWRRLGNVPRPQRSAERTARPLEEDAVPQPGDWRRWSTQRQRGHVGLGLLPLRQTPTVGRELLRDELWHAFQQCQTEGLRIVVLSGPRGAGKTHLAEWLARAAYERCGARIAHTTHAESPGPDDGLGGMISRYLGCHGLDRRRAESWLATVMSDLGEPEYEEVATTLADLVFADPYSADVPPLQRFATAEKFVLAALRSFRRSGVVVMDDVLWGPQSIGFLEHLTQSLVGQRLPLTCVVTLDDETRQERPGESQRLRELLFVSGVSELVVGPMDESTHRELVDAVLPLDRRSAEIVYQWSEGLPLLAVTLIQDWARDGRLTLQDGRWSFDGSRATSQPPSSDAWWIERFAKVARLREVPNEMGMLCLAALLGKRVVVGEWNIAIKELGWDPPFAPVHSDAGETGSGSGTSDFDNLVDVFVEEGLLVYTDGGFRFNYQSAHDGLLSLASRRDDFADLQAACAFAIETWARDQGASIPWHRIARHYVAAGDPVAGFNATFEAIESLMLQLRLTEADHLCHELERLAAEAGWAELDERCQIPELLRLRIRFSQMTSITEVRPIVELATKAQHNGWPFIEMYARLVGAQAQNQLGRVEDALLSVEKALATLVVIQRTTSGDGLNIASTIWPTDQDPQLESRLRQTRAQALARLGRIAEAKEEIARALSLLEAPKHHLLRAAARVFLSELLIIEGLFDEAEAHLTEALDSFRRVGAVAGLCDIENMLGEVARFRGDMGQARKRYETSLYFYREVNHGDSHIPEFNLALVDLEENKLREADEALNGLHQRYARLGRCQDAAICQLASLIAQLGLGAIEVEDWQARFDHLEAEIGDVQGDGDVRVLWKKLATRLEELDQDSWAERAKRAAVRCTPSA